MTIQESKQQRSHQTLAELIESLELSNLQKQYMQSRWLDQLSYMSRRARETRNWYYRLRITAIVGSVVVPILLGVQQTNSKDFLRWATIGLSGVVAVSAAVEEFFHFGDRWRHFRQTAEALKAQGWQFSQLGGLYGEYPSHQAAFQSFTTHVETLLQHENEVFVSEVVKEKPKENSVPDRDKSAQHTSSQKSDASNL